MIKVIEINRCQFPCLWGRSGFIFSALTSGLSGLGVGALAGDIVLCSWAWNFILTVPLSTQEYKWVPTNIMLN